MSRIAQLLTVATVAALLAACGARKGEVKPDLPSAGVVAEPVTVTRTVTRYVAIPAALTVDPEIAEGPLAQCPDVAAQRRAELLRVRARMREIRGIQGTEAKP